MLAAAPALAQTDPAALVNPFIGTTNGGNVFPGATAPFGMVQFSPEASPFRPGKPIAAPGGYEYRADHIRGFSLTNVEGWGCAGGSGDVPLMPVTSPVSDTPSKDYRTAYSSEFSHAKEKAEPGYYSVSLGNGVEVELTAGERTGAAVFHFPAGKPASVLIRTSDSEVGSEDAHTTVDAAARTVSGSVRSGNFCGYIGTADRRSYYTLYFAARFEEPFTVGGAWHDAIVQPGAARAQGGTGFGPKGFPEAGHGSGVWVGFGQGGRPVHVRVGISYVSEANARANLAAESTLDFAAQKQATRMAWNKRLGQIAIEGGTPEQRTVFTTALYHSVQTPTLASDTNGEYRGMDGQVHRLKGGQQKQYANFSGWDVYRSQMQLITWLDPRVGSDVAQSLLNQAQQNGGAWDRWTHNSGATHVMNGDPAAPSLADIYAFGGRDFDAKGALASLVKAADTPTPADLSHEGCPVECAGERPGLDQWLKLHYIPAGAPSWGPAADTLEDATAEFGIASLAGMLGDEATHRRFLERAQYWRNLFNPATGYIQNRNADGTWPMVRDGDEDGRKSGGLHPFTPATEDGFVEGTAAQYVWLVPFNVRGLFEAMGGTEKARARLDAFFYDDAGKPAVTKAGPLHAELDNEPSIETPWLYDFAGEPWKTQQLVRQVLDTLWKNAPDGIPGNDDLGEMSSWAVWAMLGLYPEIPGRAELVLGSPLFAKATVRRPGGDVTITASGNGPYVRTLSVDGKPWDKNFLPESFALRGGSLGFVLGAAPDKSRGAQAGAAPPSFEAGR